MKNDTSITRGSGNVFADIGIAEPEEARLKAQLILALKNQIDERKLTQTEVASKVGIAQPDLSKLLRGRTSGFSLERLLDVLRALGNDIELKVKRVEANRAGRISIKVAEAA